MRIVKCLCESCGARLEYDADESGVDTEQVECPGCHGYTRLRIPTPPLPPLLRPRLPQAAPSRPAAQSQIPAVSPPPPVEAKPRRDPIYAVLGVLFFLASALLLLIGGWLILAGIDGERMETHEALGSAVRQTVYAVQYGTGAIVAALGLILACLSALLMKERN